MYKFKDKEYTEDQLNKIAEAKGYTFDELLSNNPDIQTLEEVDVEKPQDVVEDVTVTSEPKASKSLELKSEIPLLESDPVKDEKNVESINIKRLKRKAKPNVFVKLKEDEYLDVNQSIIPEGGKLVGIMPVFSEGEEIETFAPQEDGISPEKKKVVDSETGVITYEDVILEKPKKIKQLSIPLTGDTMLRYEMPDGTFKEVNYIAGTAETEEPLDEVLIQTKVKEDPEYIENYAYTSTEETLIDDFFKPTKGSMKEDLEEGGYVIDVNKGFESAVDNINVNTFDEENLITKKDNNGVDIPGSGFNRSTFADFGFAYENESIIAENGKSIDIDKNVESIKSFLKNNKTDYKIDLNNNLYKIERVDEAIVDQQKGISFVKNQIIDITNDLRNKENIKALDVINKKSNISSPILKSINNSSLKISNKEEEIQNLKAKFDQGLISKNKYNRNISRFNNEIKKYNKKLEDLDTTPLGEWKVLKVKDKELFKGEVSTMLTLESPNGEVVKIDNADLGGNWKDLTLQEYSNKFNDLKVEEFESYLEKGNKIRFLNKLYIDKASKLSKATALAAEKYELDLKSKVDISALDISKEVLNRFSSNFTNLIYKAPNTLLGRTVQFVGNILPESLGGFSKFDNDQINRGIAQLQKDVNFVTNKYFNVDVDKKSSKQWNESFAGQATGIVTDMIFDILTTKGFGGGAVGASSYKNFLKNPTKIIASPMFARIYTQIDEDLQSEEFKDMGVKQKYLYSTGMSFIIGQLEKLGIDSTIGDGAPKVAKYVLDAVMKKGANKGLDKSVNAVLKDLVKKGVIVLGKGSAGTTGEIITEQIQELVQIGGEDLVNSINNFTGKPDETGFVNPDFGSPEMLERLKEVAKLTLVAAGPVSVTASAVNLTKESGSTKWMNDLSDTQFAANYQTFTSDNFLENEQQRLSLKVQKGELTQDEADNEYNISRTIKETMMQIPSGLTTRNQQAAFENIERIKELEAEIEGKNPELVKKQKDEIKSLKEANEEISQKGDIYREKLIQSVEKLSGSKVTLVTEENKEQLIKDLNLTEDQAEDLENGAAVVGDGSQILLDDKADPDILLRHEDRHNFFRKVLSSNPDSVFKLSKLLKDKINSLPGNETAKKFIEARETQYLEDPNYGAAELAEEYIMFFADSLTDQNVVTGLKNDSLFTKIKDSFRRLYSDTFNKEVKIKNTNDLINLLKDHERAINKGKESRRLKAFREGKAQFDFKEDDAADVRAIEEAQREEEIKLIKEETDQEVSDVDLSQSKQQDIKTTLDAIVQLPDGSKKFKTKTEFVNDPNAAFEAYNKIQNTRLIDGIIKNTYIERDPNLSSLPDNIKQDIVSKVKENVSERVLRNFDPAKNESLFGYVAGRNGQIDFALRDIKKDYVKEVKGVSIDKKTPEGQSFDIEDTSTDIIEEVDRGVAKKPRSTFRRNIVRGREKGLTDEEVTSFKEVTQPIVDKLPPVDDKKYRTKVDQISGRELKSWVKENIFKGQDYKNFIRENYNNIRDLDLKYLIELDKGLMKQGKERMFTRPNRRLTMQADIRKYRDSGRAFVENEAQGVMLYDILDPGADATVEFYTKQTPQNVSNRKGKLAEAFGKKMFKDVLPETRAKKGDTDQQRATSARKTQTRPNLLFAKKGVNEALKSLGLVPLRPRNSKGDVVSQEDIKEFEDFLINTFVKYLPVSLLTKTTLANGGRGKFPSQYFTSEQVDEIIAKARGNQDFNLTKEDREALNSVKTSVSTWWDKFKSTGDGVFKNKKWKETEGQKQKGLEILWKQFEKMYKDDPKNAKYIAAFIETSSANSSHIMRMAGYPIGYEVNWKDTLSYRGPEREHVIPANQIGEFLFKVATGRFGNKITIDNVIPFINDNYFQILINKNNDHKLKAAGFQSAMPEGFFESIIEAIDKNDPNIAMKVWARYFNPEVNNQVGPDGQKGFNPNEIILEKGSLADAFGIGSNILSKQEINNPNIVSIQQDLIYKMSTDPSFTIKDAQKELLTYIKKPSNTQSLADEQQQATLETEKEIKESNVMVASKKMDIDELLSKAASIDLALKNANSLDQPIKKIRVFDFDDTIATSKSIVFYTKVDGTKGQLTAEEFAIKGADLINERAVMDFSDFNLVREGKRGPLFNIAKKIKEARGNEDLFILTARAPESQQAIYEFLKAEGLEFKKENIVGLGNSTGEAKANWIIDKAAEGYNDFYFADDDYQNVKAVRDALSVIDVKSKVQQARIKQSKNLSTAFNKVLEESTGIEFFKEYSPAKAKTIGANKGKFKFFIPYSAEDFMGLIYPTLSKGKIGDSQMAWYKKHVLNPYAQAIEGLTAARINLMEDFKQLKKSLDVPKDLRKKNESGFTNEQAVRVYLWNRANKEIPGLSKRDLKELNDAIENNVKLKTFADQLLNITKEKQYTDPGDNWLTGTITTDLIDLINKEKRSKFLKESGYTDNVEAIYSKENLNKLEALYGTKYREAMENMLARMKSGRNRVQTGNTLSNRVLDYINGSIGTIMFFNTRSAVLQTISSINFVNWNFNNPYQAGKAFANQKQYWKDFVKLMNSDYLRDRRNGLKLNISESEIADAAATSKNKAKAALNYILQKGYLPTQYADSFAIASGGATFYRNRIKDLIKNEGKTELEAEEQAMLEWRETAEISQQSSDPSKISSQQSSDLGRIVLAFANTPMQYARIQKRAIQDLINGRGDWKSNISKVLYYGFVQNLIFNTLQQAVFALGFGDDEDEELKEKKTIGVANGMLDSLLRGLGIGGQAVSVAKNFLMDVYERSNRDRPEYVDSVWKLTQFSPPISSKISKLKQAAWNFDSKKRRKKMFTKGFSLDNPAYEASAKVVSATTNVPLDRVLNKINNIEGGLNEDNEVWERIAMLLGWPEWQIKPKKSKKKKRKSLFKSSSSFKNEKIKFK